MAPMVGPRAFVHIEASGTTVLYRAAQGTTDYETICEAPCDMDLPINDDYKIGGNGTKTTERFKLKAYSGRVILKVDGANWFGIVGGVTLATVGATVGYVGLLLAAGAGEHGRSRDNGPVGLTAFLVGGVATALGGYAFVRSNTTDVIQTAPKPGDGALLHLPSWRSVSATEHGSPATFPLLYERRF